MRNPFRSTARPVGNSFAARTTTPDTQAPVYFGTPTPEPEWTYDEPGLSVAVIDGGVPVGTFTYADKYELARAIEDFGDLYGADGTVTLVITAL